MARNDKAQDVQAQDVTEAPEAPQAPAEAPSTEAPSTEAQEGTVTPQAIAEALGIDAKAWRRWYRTQARQALGREGAADVLPGKGKRYGFAPAEAQALIVAYSRAKAHGGTSAGASSVLTFLGAEAPEA